MKLKTAGCRMATEVSLSDAKAYFEQIVKPSVDDFMSSPSHFRTAFNAATALFHMHEWLFEFKRSELETKYRHTCATKCAFWKHVEPLVPSSKYIRNLANASKHVRLTLRPSTSMTHIAKTVIQSPGWGEGAYGMGRYGGQNVMMKDGPNDVSLNNCVANLMALWDRSSSNCILKTVGGHKTRSADRERTHDSPRLIRTNVAKQIVFEVRNVAL